jgi:hypothetical protein
VVAQAQVAPRAQCSYCSGKTRISYCITPYSRSNSRLVTPLIKPHAKLGRTLRRQLVSAIRYDTSRPPRYCTSTVLYKFQHLGGLQGSRMYILGNSAERRLPEAIARDQAHTTDPHPHLPPLPRRTTHFSSVSPRPPRCPCRSKYLEYAQRLTGEAETWSGNASARGRSNGWTSMAGCGR